MARRILLTVAALSTVVTFASACTSANDPAQAPTSTSSSASVTKTPSQSLSSSSSTPAPATSSSASSLTTQSIEQNAQGMWLAFWRLSVSLASTAEGQRPAKVAAVAVDPIYGQVLNSVRGELAAGLRPFGYIVSRPTWPTPPAASAQKTVMADCFDGSHAGTRVAKTGKTKTIGEPRTNVRVTFVKGRDSKWRIAQIEYLKASC